VKIVVYNGQFRITLPKDLVRDKGWDASTELRFVEDEQGRIYLKPIEPKTTKRQTGGGTQ
jgi:bifunctional DNA-binding transcriptional regulator/antitoxin component of YhaV-PrlF toxin-antitoxin module